jgi:hypothetical protein
VIPARPVPVSAQVRGAARHDYYMAEADRDLLLASRAHVGLTSLKRVDLADVNLALIDQLTVHTKILVDQAG